jgi:hypothetical protein
LVNVWITFNHLSSAERHGIGLGGLAGAPATSNGIAGNPVILDNDEGRGGKQDGDRRAR